MKSGKWENVILGGVFHNCFLAHWRKNSVFQLHTIGYDCFVRVLRVLNFWTSKWTTEAGGKKFAAEK